MDCSPTVYCVNGVSQARILEWVAISFSRGSSWPREEELGHVLLIKGKAEHQTLGCLVFLLAQFSSVQLLLCLTLCDPMDFSRARPPCPSSPTPGVYSNSCPSSQWCHPTISSSVVPFSSRLQSFPASGSFPMSQLFKSGDQNISLKLTTHTQDFRRLSSSKEPALSMKNCCHLVATSSRTTLKRSQGVLLFKGLWWFSSSVVSNSLWPRGL